MHPMRAVPVAVLALALGSLTAGCGPSDGGAPGTDEAVVSSADQACRDRWHDLSTEVGIRSARGATVRRAFESRWESIGAGIGYYESTARADQCGDLLAAQKRSIEDLNAVVGRALRFDLEARAARAGERRQGWRAKHPAGREPKAVRRAYRTVRVKVPLATRDLAPAMTELAGVDPAREKAVKRALKDLTLLAGTSEAYVLSYHALHQVYEFVVPPEKEPQKKTQKKPKKTGKKG